MNGLTAAQGGVRLTVRVVPRASKDEICGAIDGVLRIRLRAPPVDNKANLALVEFLAERLGVPRRNIALLGGRTGRTKRVQALGVSEQQAKEKLGIA